MVVEKKKAAFMAKMAKSDAVKALGGQQKILEGVRKRWRAELEDMIDLNRTQAEAAREAIKLAEGYDFGDTKEILFQEYVVAGGDIGTGDVTVVKYH